MTDWYSHFRAQMLDELADILGLDVSELPPVFAAPGRPKALKVGIHKDLLQRYPDLDGKRLKVWLARWTHPIQYLERLVQGSNRHDLDGQDCELITDEHRKHAAARLKTAKLRMEARRAGIGRKESYQAGKSGARCIGA